MRKKSKSRVLMATVIALSVLLIVTIIALIIYCNKDDNNDEIIRVEIVKEPLSESKPVEKATPESKPKPEFTAEFDQDSAVEIRPEPVSESDERYNLYEVSKSFLEDMPGCFVKRNGKLYNLDGFVPTSSVRNVYHIGSAGTNTNRDGQLFWRDSSPAKMPTNTPFALITIGDLPILQISKTEKIGRYGRDSISLFKTSFVGYTISVIERTNNTMAVINGNWFSDDIELACSSKDRCGVSDSSGNQVKDIRNLEYKKDYVFHWYSGTEYHEVTMKADCKAFEYSEDKEIILQGEQNGSEYFEFDLSKLHPGFYLTDHGAFELVE